MTDDKKLKRKKAIIGLLLTSRSARLLLEAACWVHDLDKASWPFALFANPRESEQNYDHNKQPDRGKNGYNWEEQWLTRVAGTNELLNACQIRFDALIPEGVDKIRLKFVDSDDGQKFDLDICEMHSGKFADPFRYHSAYHLIKSDIKTYPSWETLILNTAFGGPDGIDSEYFKGGKEGKKWQSGIDQRAFPPKVATPFGYERIALGDADDAINFKKKNEELFRQLWQGAFAWTVSADESIPDAWFRIREALIPPLRIALGYTPRPTNDVNLWDHSHGVGAMAKVLAAALCLDAAAAKKNGKKILFPRRSPERYLPDLSDLSDYLQAGTGSGLSLEEFQRQVQSKFKVLSILLRDTARLNLGRRIGDVLAFHDLRNERFKAIARVIEEDLAVGTEIFRDHAGIHFLLPWCQDSRDAHLKDGSEIRGEPRSQDLLEEMIREAVTALWAGQGASAPAWWQDDLPAFPVWGSPSDMDVLVHIGPTREPLSFELAENLDKAVQQGILFLKDRTSVRPDLDRRNPRRLPRIDPAGSGTLCPVCRVRPAGSSRGDTLETPPCPVCEVRRSGRAEDWWKGLCETKVISSTIWTAEAADNDRRVTLLTIAFDLGRWFGGTAFDGYWMPNTYRHRPEVKTPVYPAPARIRGVWEATQDFISEGLNHIKSTLKPQRRIVYRVSETAAPFLSAGRGVLLDPPDDRSGIGQWFLGRDSNDQLWLLSVDKRRKQTADPADLQKLSFAGQEGRRIYPFPPQTEFAPISSSRETEEQNDDRHLMFYQPLIEVLTDSPTRFQILIPARPENVTNIEILAAVGELFQARFGKVFHHMEACIQCLTFKDKFPFYLALEAADRFVAREMERARFRERTGILDVNGLAVALDDRDPARRFLGDAYRWTCLDPKQRDIYRSTVHGSDSKNHPYNEKPLVFYGWNTSGQLSRFERSSYWTADPTNPMITIADQSDDVESFFAACPRFAWAHLAAPGERYEEQLTIPLAAFDDWLSSYDAVSNGSRDMHCEGCLQLIAEQGIDDAGTMQNKCRKFSLKGLSDRQTQLRHLVEEILDAHKAWPPETAPEADRPAVLARHIHLLCRHPNGLGTAWKAWATVSSTHPCPLAEEIGQYLQLRDRTLNDKKGMLSTNRDRCKNFIKRLAAGAQRFEKMSQDRDGASLLVTFDLLNRVCKYHVPD